MPAPNLRVIVNPDKRTPQESVSLHTLPEPPRLSSEGRLDEQGWYRIDEETPPLTLAVVAWGIRDMMLQAYQDGWINDHDLRNWAAGEGAFVLIPSRGCVSWSAYIDNDREILLAQGCDATDIMVGDPPGHRPKDWLLRLQWEAWIARFDDLLAVLSPPIRAYFAQQDSR